MQFDWYFTFGWASFNDIFLGLSCDCKAKKNYVVFNHTEMLFRDDEQWGRKENQKLIKCMNIVLDAWEDCSRIWHEKGCPNEISELIVIFNTNPEDDRPISFPTTKTVLSLYGDIIE